MWQGFTWKFNITNRWQFGPNWHQIPWLFHIIYAGFICFPCSNLTWILDKFKSWNFHGIYWENDGISIGFGLIFEPNQTTVKKAWENPWHTFHRVCSILILVYMAKCKLNESIWVLDFKINFYLVKYISLVHVMCQVGKNLLMTDSDDNVGCCLS